MFVFSGFSKEMIFKLDPRIKLVSVLLLTVLVFFVDKLLVSVCIVLFVIIVRLVTGIPFHWKRIRNLSLLALFVILIQVLFGPGDNNLVFPFFGGIAGLKWDGFLFGLMIVCRLCALLLVFPIFTETVSPYQIAVALHGLGFNYRSAFVITTTFNLIPMFREEALIIMDAQRLRGMRSFDEGSLIAKMKAYSNLAVPLVLGAMQRAQNSSVAMESKAFGAYKERTWLDKPAVKAKDIIVIFICIIFFTFLLSLNYYI
jgi:energy-coupling factor transport system permease protein